MNEVSYHSQGRTQITLRTGKGCIVDQRITRKDRVLIQGVGVRTSYPDCGDIYPAALAQARGWLAEFANQSNQVIYDDEGRVAQIRVMDDTGVTLVATKTVTRTDDGLLDSIRIEEAVSGKVILRRLIRDENGRIIAVNRVFSRRS